MEFAVLGPLDVTSDGVPVELRGAKERALLAHLIAYHGRMVPAEDLMQTLWGDQPPRSAAKSLQTFVLRVRNALEPDRGTTPSLVLTAGPGYRLAVDPMDLDAERFARLVRLGREALKQGRPEIAAATLDEALALWRGPAYTGFQDTAFGQAEARRLEELRLTAAEDRCTAELEQDRPVAAIPELERLLGQHPLRERLWELLMLALYRNGQQGDALGAFERARAVLAEELGVDPGPTLRQLHAQVLAQDASLSLRRTSSVPGQLEQLGGPLIGRESELDQLLQAWSRARAGEAVGFMVRGPAGAGKSHLASALARELARDGTAITFTDDATDGDKPVAAPPGGLLVIDRAAAPPVRPGSMSMLLASEHAVPPDDYQVIDLRPLAVDDIRKLVSGYVSAGSLDSATETVLDKSQGWPARAHEVAARLSREAAVRRVGRAAAVADSSRQRLADARDELADGITVLRRVDSEPALQGVCPWRGLESYDVTDSPWFAGRERLVAELTARVAGAQVLGVVGASGSGKSSVVRAGLLAALDRDILPGSATWTQLVMRPGQHPMRELTRLALGTHRTDIGDLLSRLASTAEVAPTGRVVLVVDQMEEVWTACTDEGERAAFLDLLGEAARDAADVTVVLVLRADFVGALADHPGLASAMADSTVLVGSPTPDDVRRAVEIPARRGGLVLDEGLADAIVGDAGSEPGILPLLSAALTQLWEQRREDRLPFAAYVGMGGLPGAIAHLAEAAFLELDEAARQAVRLLFLRLAGPGDGAAVVRRRVTLRELEALGNEDVPNIVDGLAAARLLTVSEGSVEVAHEALFREWPRLKGWLAEDVAGRDVQRRLAVAAAEWHAEGQDSGQLWRGTRLAAGLEVADLRPEEVTSVERAFLDVSRDAVESERRAIEQRAASTARQNRRLRWLLVGLAAVVIAALVAGVLAVGARNRAERSEKSAEARRLAASALNEDYPDLALLSALEAISLERSPETYGALLTLLSREPEVITRVRTPDRFLRIAATPDGQTVFLAENVGLVSAFDALTGERRWEAHAPDVGPNALTVSPDGRSLLVLGSPESGTARLLDARTGRTVWDVVPDMVEDAQDGGSTVIADGAGWLPDGRPVFATGSHVLLADAKHGAPLQAIPWPRPRLFPGRLVVWPTGELSLDTEVEPPLPRRFDPLHPARGFATLPGTVVAVSPEARRLLVMRGREGGGALQVYTRSGHHISPRSEFDGFLATASFSPDGREVVVGFEDHVEVRDATSLVVIHEFEAHNGAVMGAAFAGPRHNLIWTAGRDGTAAALDLTGHRGLFRTRRIPTAPTTGQAATASTTAVITTFYPDRVNPARLVDVTTGRDLFGELQASPTSCLCQVEGTAITSDGSLAAGAVTEFDPDNFSEVAGGLVLWDTADGSVRNRVALPWPAYAVALTPDGERAVVNGQSGVAVVDVGTATVVAASTGQAPFSGVEGLPTVAITPDGAKAIVGRDNRLIELDLATGRVLRQFELPERDLVTSLVWSAEAETLVMGEITGFIRFLSVDDFQPVAPARLIAAGYVANLQTSPDGRFLASLGTDGDLLLWDTTTWRPYGKPLSDNHGWGVLAFSPDGDRLRVLYEDHTMLDMSVRPEDWVAQACRAANRDLTPEESAVIRPGLPQRSTCEALQ